MTRDEIARIAMRYDTALSRAMLRALGIEPPNRKRPSAKVRVDRYAGTSDLMRQAYGVRM